MSTEERKVGEVSVKDGGKVEWTIKGFWCPTVCVSFVSPSFVVSGCRWYLKLSSSPRGANFTFGLKNVGGIVGHLKDDITSNYTREERAHLGQAEVWSQQDDITWVFGDESDSFEAGCLFGMSESLRRKSELPPSGALTVTCTLWVKNTADYSARLDTLSQNLLDMFTSKRGCDATLKVKHREFSVHKCILSARSAVFAAMFEADMRERNTGVVDIVDCDPEVFREFLIYLYSGKVDKFPSSPFELYKIADKYDVKELKLDCLISIMSNLNMENVLDAAILGRQFSLTTLTLKTKYFFNVNFKKIIPTAKWESFLLSNGLLANELLKYMVSEME